MARLLPIFVALVCSASSSAWAQPAAPPIEPTRASELAWEPVGPTTTSAGMTAVATDPEDSRVIWVGSSTSVWVSDDGGATWNLVLQLSRASGLAREAGDGDPIELDPDDPTVTPDGEDIDDVEDLQFEDEIIVDPRSGRIDRNSRDDEEPDDEVGESDGTEDTDDEIFRFGVTRFRVLQDKVWVCTSRGLWSIARSARRTGTGVEVRFGRRLAVNDVARGADKKLYLGTERGLWQLGDDGIGRQITTVEDDVEVRAIQVVTLPPPAGAAPAPTRMVLATSRGLRMGDGERFERVSIGGKDEAGLDDVVIEPGGRVAVAGNGNVYRMDATASIVDEAWPVPGASRLAIGRQGQLWTVGPRGAWRYSADEGWARVVEGLFDRRLADVAPSDAGEVHLWVVGRAGLWRLVPESARVYASQIGALEARALTGYMDSEETVAAALKARGVRMSSVDSWVIEERLAWLLPRVYVNFRAERERHEDFISIALLDRQILDQVDVRPLGDELRIEARWDVMPAVLAAIEGSSPRIEATRVRARRAQERVREVVLPLWQTWAKKRMDYETSEPADTRAALRDLLMLAKLEADLHVYTGGRFPVGGAKAIRKAE